MDKLRQQELLQEIKAKTDIVEVISEYVTLRRSGRSLLGLCPFHPEKTPSFNVNQDKQFYYCFGCGAGGDVFSFIMKLEQLDFPDAAHRLADRAGVPWPETTETEADRQKDDLFRINQLAMTFFTHCLVKTENGAAARRYLEMRGIAPATWERFNLGYAPEGWHHLTEVLRRKEIPLQQAESIGLVGFGENGYYDRFRHRLIFPILDVKGRVVGFGGRSIDQSEPKYLNSPETPLFHKGHFCYGLNLAKETMKKQHQGIVVEGYLDVIQAHQAGFTQTVASLGTALTREQGKLICRYAPAVILAYDADTAGQNATIRGMEILQQAGLKVRILRMTSGDDPDSFIKTKGAAEFAGLIENAVDLVEFKIDQILRQYDVKSPDGKAQAVQAVFPQLARVESDIARETYIRLMARRIGVEEVTILEEYRRWIRSNRKNSPVLDKPRPMRDTSETGQTPEAVTPNAYAVPVEKLTPLRRALYETEKELLKSILQEYDKFARIKEELKAEELSFAVWRDLFQSIAALDISCDTQDFSRIMEELTGPLRETAATFMAELEMTHYQGDPDGLLNRWRMLRLQERIDQLTTVITSGKDEAGQPLPDSVLKEKLREFTALKREMQKSYPHFSAGIC